MKYTYSIYLLYIYISYIYIYCIIFCIYIYVLENLSPHTCTKVFIPVVVGNDVNAFLKGMNGLSNLIMDSDTDP